MRSQRTKWSTSGDLIFFLFSCSSLRALAVLGAGGRGQGKQAGAGEGADGGRESERNEASLVLRKPLLLDWEEFQ